MMIVARALLAREPDAVRVEKYRQVYFEQREDRFYKRDEDAGPSTNRLRRRMTVKQQAVDVKQSIDALPPLGRELGRASGNVILNQASPLQLSRDTGGAPID